MSACRFDTRSPEETRTLAERLGHLLRAGDIVCLNGDLGAGKTTFTQGLALGLGLPPDEPIRSPTFTLLAEHPGGRFPLYHFDVYRLPDSSGLADLAFDEYLDAGGVVVIEWASKITEALPGDRLEIHLSLGTAAETREIELRSYGNAAALTEALCRAGEA